MRCDCGMSAVLYNWSAHFPFVRYLALFRVDAQIDHGLVHSRCGIWVPAFFLILIHGVVTLPCMVVVEGEFVHLVEKSFPWLNNSVTFMLVYICTFLVRLWTEAQLVKPVSLVVRKDIWRERFAGRSALGERVLLTHPQKDAAVIFAAPFCVLSDPHGRLAVRTACLL